MELKFEKPKITQIFFYSKEDDRNTFSYERFKLTEKLNTETQSLDLIGTGIDLSSYTPAHNFSINTIPGTKVRFSYNDKDNQPRGLNITINDSGKYIFNCKNILTPTNIGIEEKSLDIIDMMPNGYFIMTLY